MKIKDDVLSIVKEQEKFKKKIGRYVQALKTSGTEKEMLRPSDEKETAPLSVSETDYAYRVDVWEGPDGDGFMVTSERDLGDGVLETVMYRSGDTV